VSEYDSFINSIAITITDYRMGDLATPTPEHVSRWVNQFNVDVQLPILREMDHVLKKTYFSFKKVTQFLNIVLNSPKLTGADPSKFWNSVRFLNIQGGGNSQHDILAIFDKLLNDSYGININQYEGQPESFIYLDDAIFTGNRVLRDITTWLKNDAPNNAKVHIVSIALHNLGHYYAEERILKAANEAGKNISITFWSSVELEDRLAYTDSSDVLRPASIPNVPEVNQYVEAMKFKPRLRTPGNTGSKNLFSSEQGRNLLEQEFLKAGVKIREMCPNLGNTQRPLGHMTLDTLGFGSLIVTFRNCPNNAPLALWVDVPWYPLFPRTTNTQTSTKRFMSMFTDGGFNGI